MKNINNIIFSSFLIIFLCHFQIVKNNLIDFKMESNFKNMLLEDSESSEDDELLKVFNGILENVKDLMSNLIILSVYNATDSSIYPSEDKLLEEARKCYYSYKIFDDNSDESIKARNYYLTLIYHDSSKSKNDLGSYLDCTKSQTVSLTDLKITKEEKEKFQKDSTYIIFQINEKKNSSFADIGYLENEYLVGLCLKKGCSENVLRKTFVELNKEITFFEEFNYSDIDVYDLDSDKIDKNKYFVYWIPFMIILIIICFSCFRCIPNLVFRKMNPRLFNDMKECFNLKNNHEEIFGNFQDNENIVSNDTGLSIVKGLRGLNMIAVLISTSFFYIYHLPTKIYNKDTFKDFITSFWFSVVYYGFRFGIKILYAMSGFELVYKMLNYLDNCIENKEKAINVKDENENLVKEYSITNEYEDSERTNSNKNIDNDIDNMIYLKNKLIDDKKSEQDNKDEEEDEEDEEEEKENQKILMEELKIKYKNNSRSKSNSNSNSNSGGDKKNSIEKDKNIQNDEPIENYFSDFDNIDLTNEDEIKKLNSINKVLYKRHRSKLEGDILKNFILKQWHKYFMFILAIFFFKYGVIQPFLIYYAPSPMWLIHIRQIANKFTLLHIFSNIFCFSPFSYKTYNGIDPFGMAYNEIIFFLLGSVLIFYSYKYCLRLDLITIFGALFFFLIKMGIGVYYLFINDDDDNYNLEETGLNHGFYPLMFFQYNEDNLRIKSFLFSNQFLNLPYFLLGILFGEMNYCIQNFSKANDKNKRYLSVAKRVLNCFSRIKKMRIIYLILLLILFALSVFTYCICIKKAGVDEPDDFFINSWYNLIGLIDTDIGVIFYFLFIVLFLLCGDNIFANFLRHKYWGIFSRNYWTFLLTLHICTCFVFYLSENRIKLIFYNVVFFSFEILMIVIVTNTLIYICVEIPLKKINKIFIKNKDELLFYHKNK